MLEPIDDQVKMLTRNNFNIEIVSGQDRDMLFHIGVRLRPYGKRAPKDVMYWGYADDLSTAFDRAVTNAMQDKRMALDWALRPWDNLAGASEQIGYLWR